MKYVAIAALSAILVPHLALAAEPVAPATLPATAPAPAEPTPVLPATAPATPKAPAPTTEIAPAGCVTPDCHANVKSYRFMHGPVNVDACDACRSLGYSIYEEALVKDGYRYAQFINRRDREYQRNGF